MIVDECATVKCNSSVYPMMITVATACNGVKECLFGEDEGPLFSGSCISTIILTVTCLAFVSIYLGLKCSRIISLKMNRNMEELELPENRTIEWRASLELTTNIIYIFFCFSTFTQFHPVILQHEIGRHAQWAADLARRHKAADSADTEAVSALAA